ncbi:hypothetical protein JDV09_08060 [Mycobacterium sp. Y57]|uniref:hypothetical protein n=1 Tax=Mycolicibacterium xanthum TaxID=2796469 RepID=UPI001C8473F6|nr:hypothetical protein [Mycolicibacterium xanthum]MBX7432060.1 hypothetical protein [Mycolicibacterium xanthum]
MAIAYLIALALACQTDFPAHAETTDLGCRRLVAAVDHMRNDLVFPPQFSQANPTKEGTEFDPNRYFEAFTHLRMRDGYVLDYVYHQDGVGGYPLLYARPANQPPYARESDYRAVPDHPDYLAFVVPQDSPEGYFEFVVFVMSANQFYRDWHAEYNDWRVLCGAADIEETIQSLAGPDFAGRPMTAEQIRAAHAIEDPTPSVVMNDQTATVTMLAFTKWGGFYRRTRTISRENHSILDEGSGDGNTPLVDYDCGIALKP